MHYSAINLDAPRFMLTVGFCGGSLKRHRVVELGFFVVVIKEVNVILNMSITQ